MKTLRSFFLAVVAVVAVGGGVSYAVSTFGNNKANRLHDVIYDCTPAANLDPYYGGADNTGNCAAWSSRSTSTSTSETITVKGAHVGDACLYVPGVSVGAVAQALDWTCAITAIDAATLRVTNASGGSLTPTTGRRGVMVIGIAR